MRVVLVTGSNRGIGLELVRQAVERGDRVHATCRDPSRAKELVPGPNLIVHALDVRSETSVDGLAQALAGESLDVLINNAGVYGERDGLRELDLEDALATYDTNALGPLRVTRRLLPNLEKGTEKKVLMITSKMGSIGDNGSGGSYGYRMSKAALNMAARSLAIDLRPLGILCATVNPGWVQTDMGGHNAPTTVEACAKGIWDRIDRLSSKENGEFIDYAGRPNIPW